MTDEWYISHKIRISAYISRRILYWDFACTDEARANQHRMELIHNGIVVKSASGRTETNYPPSRITKITKRWIKK